MRSPATPPSPAEIPSAGTSSAATAEELRAELEWQLQTNLELRAQLEQAQWLAAGPSPAALTALLPLLRLLLPQPVQPAAAVQPSPANGSPAIASPAIAIAWLDQAWQHLSRGETQAATELQHLLLRSPQLLGAASLQQLDHLGRVLATQHWLIHNNAVAPAQYDGNSQCGLRVALDHLALSSCQRVLMLEGWCIDPAQQLAALYLLRGHQAWPVPLVWLRRYPRPDLEGLLQQQGLQVTTPAGLRLASPLPPPTPALGASNARASSAGALPASTAPALLVVLHNGLQFCLMPPLPAAPLLWPELIEHLNVLVQGHENRNRNRC